MKKNYTLNYFFTAFVYLIAVHILSAQTIRLKEIMLNSTLSGNSFGVQRNPAIGFLIGKNVEIIGGPVFNRGFQKHTGSLLTAHYYLVHGSESYDGHLRLSSFVTIQRLRNQSLCKEVLNVEERMSFNMKNEAPADFEKLRYKGWEATIGVACAYRFDFGMIVHMDAGISYYATSRECNSPVNAFHEELGTSLRLGFGIGWSLSGKIIPKASANAQAVTVRATI